MNLSGKLLTSAITAALGGFIFGFDTVVISGAEQRIQELWGLSSGMHGLATSAALWGTVLGALGGGWPTDRWGRRGTLIWIGILYLISALWSALATDVYSFMAARFLGGLGIGISTVASPLYIAEIAPAAWRGRLAGMFQFNIVFGILVAYLSNAMLEGGGENAWRWMLGVEAIPALLYTLLCWQIPESPRYLIHHRRDREAGLNVLRQVYPSASVAERNQLADQIEQLADVAPRTTSWWSRRLAKPLLLAMLIALFNQLSGINAMLYFAPRIFGLTGLEERAAMLTSVGIGLTNLAFTFVGLYLIDRTGRRRLMYLGSWGYILSLSLCSWAFFREQYAIVPVCIFAFIAAHAVGQGTVIWVFISEIFPNQYRALGQSVGSSTHWIAAAVITLLFPLAVTHFAPATIFAFFASMMLLQLIWVWRAMPETRGVPLETLEQQLGTTDGPRELVSRVNKW